MQVSRKGLVKFVAVIAPLLAAVLCYAFYVGLYCSDDTRYLIGIQKIVAGEHIDLHSNAERRLIFLLPGALAYGITGRNDAAVGIYAVFFVLSTVAAWFGARRFGTQAALVASILTALTPVMWAFAGALFPDVISACVVGAQMVLLMTVINRAEGGGLRVYRLFAIGLLAMLGIAIKESNAVIVIIPFAFLMVASVRNNDWASGMKAIFVILLGCISCILVESVLYRQFAGQWHISLMNSASDHNFLAYIKGQGLYPWTRFATLFRELDAGTALIFLMGVMSMTGMALLTLIDRLRVDVWQWTVPAAFFLCPLIYFTIGTASFRVYMPPVIQARYFAPCVVPAAILIAFMFCHVRWTLVRQTLVIATVVFLLWIVCGRFSTRGTAYWSLARDSLNMALMDAQVVDPRLTVVAANGTVNTEVQRCLRHILRDGGARYWATADEEGIEAPFFLLGDSQESLVEDNSAVGRRIHEKVRGGEWDVGSVGYYFANRKLDLEAWWLPRQAALKYEYTRNRAAFHRQTRPEGKVPWEVREMHSELYLVYPRDRRGWWNDSMER